MLKGKNRLDKIGSNKRGEKNIADPYRSNAHKTYMHITCISVCERASTTTTVQRRVDLLPRDRFRIPSARWFRVKCRPRAVRKSGVVVSALTVPPGRDDLRVVIVAERACTRVEL
jgi:hypothetical protein